MPDSIQEFFGFGPNGYTRPAEGAYSWQHLLFVTVLFTTAFLLAVLLGNLNRRRSAAVKNIPLIFAAVLIDSIEIFRICICLTKDPTSWKVLLPLFLCSISLFSLPLAAFARGRVREIALDYVTVFGILIAVVGTVGAAQNYGTYPVLSFDNVVSGLTHCISGFAGLYIYVARMASMKKQNIGITFTVLIVFSIAAYVVDRIIPYNYMFLMRGDGTPYDYLYDLLGGSPVLYPAVVVIIFCYYIFIHYFAFYLIRRSRAEKAALAARSAEAVEACEDIVSE